MAFGGNRPFRRYLARLYCILRYGRAWSHAEEWWPGLELRQPGAAQGAILYRGQTIAPLLSYPSLPAGLRELVIVGTGPSLARQVRARIPVEASLLLNGAIHLIDRNHGPKPFGVVIEDERFVWQHAQTIVDRVAPGTHCYFSTAVIRALCENAPRWLAEQNVHHLNFVHHPYQARKRSVEDMRHLPFLRWSADKTTAISLAPQSGLVIGGSVAASAAQIALFMAPPRIGLAGVDLTNTALPRFYETTQDRAMSRLDAAIEGILAMFSLVAREGAERGIVFENYSPVSRLAEIGITYVPKLER